MYFVDNKAGANDTVVRKEIGIDSNPNTATFSTAIGRYLGQVAVVDKAGNISNVTADPDARTKMYAYGIYASETDHYGIYFSGSRFNEVAWLKDCWTYSGGSRNCVANYIPTCSYRIICDMYQGPTITGALQCGYSLDQIPISSYIGMDMTIDDDINLRTWASNTGAKALYNVKFLGLTGRTCTVNRRGDEGSLVHYKEARLEVGSVARISFKSVPGSGGVQKGVVYSNSAMPHCCSWLTNEFFIRYISMD